MTKKQELIDLLKKTGAIKFGEFKLSSGEKSNYYIDIKKASTSPEFLRVYGKEVENEIKDEAKLAGIALGGIPLVVAASIYSGKPYLMIRKEKKKYGTGERVEGAISDNKEILIIEDVTTTGKSLLDGVDVIREAGGEVNKSIVVVDREQGAKELLNKNGVKLIPLIKSGDLVNQKRMEEKE